MVRIKRHFLKKKMLNHADYFLGYTGNYQNQQQQMFNQQQPTQAFNHQQPPPPQFPSPDRVSFMEKQQAVLDKIPSYDRK